MANNQRLLDWLDDLCVRFIVNLPHEELQSVERICFQIEEAQWFYEDFIRPLDPGLPSMNLRVFSQRMFQHCPLFANFTEAHREGAYAQFLEYKTRVPVRGAIMLNEEMTHAVLVKGWKKGAKWSFPRGKINKDENDLDCAVREVYEETGLDLQAAGLVQPEEEMKAIEVNMREQSLKLYIFRGVPMDTYFEPRTRKEISKIDWYKLGDLPTIKRKNQIQQGAGQDLVRDNSFYMVTPFVGPLKGWIKRQKQLDRQNKPTGAQLALPTAAGITDTELEVDVGDTTADEAPMAEYNPDSANFAQLIANMGRTHHASDALPEVQAEPSPDPAAELKRLLSVGAGFSLPAPPSQTHELGQGGLPTNGMFDFLQGHDRPLHPNSVPRTPFNQVLSAPQMPQSPHGQHHPRPPHLEHMPPPPHFPFRPPQGLPFQGQQHSHISSQPLNGFPAIPHQFFTPPPPQHQPQHHFPPHPPNVQQIFGQQPQRPYHPANDSRSTQQPAFQSQPGFQSQRGPAVPPASKLPPPKLTTHTLGLLNTFKINEKPALPSPQTPREAAQSSQVTPRVQQLPAMHRPSKSYISSPGVHSADPYAPSPPAFQSPPPVANFETVQPKPRNAHQDNLLSLFGSPSIIPATPALQKSPEEPAELSAFPSTPGISRTKSGPKAAPPMPDMNAKPVTVNASTSQRTQAGNTSATVHGPVNAPDFDTMKKKSQHLINVHSRGPSPAMPKAEQKMFVPQQILKREGAPKGPAARMVTSPSPQPSPQTAIPPTAAFQPRILKRPQQPTAVAPIPVEAPVPAPAPTAHVQGLLGLFKSQTSPPPAAAPMPMPPTQVAAPVAATAPKPNTHTQGLLGLFKTTTSPQPIPTPPAQMPPPPTQVLKSHDRREPCPTDQRTALLGLFTKSSPKPTPSPLAPASPIPLGRSPQPPTPKNLTLMSGIISPVSPLPTGSQTGSPANFTSRSRISSIGDTFSPGVGFPQQGGGVAMAPTSHPAMTKNGFDAEDDFALLGSGPNKGLPLDMGLGKAKENLRDDGKSPVDKNFLLGFLNDFAKKGSGPGR